MTNSLFPVRERHSIIRNSSSQSPHKSSNLRCIQFNCSLYNVNQSLAGKSIRQTGQAASEILMPLESTTYFCVNEAKKKV